MRWEPEIGEGGLRVGVVDSNGKVSAEMATGASVLLCVVTLVL